MQYNGLKTVSFAENNIKKIIASILTNNLIARIVN